MSTNHQGVVFNIQKYSVHDGAGIRTLVFLKGCPLRCLWCSNPESQSLQPERSFNPSRCLGTDVCDRCLAVCPHGAISEAKGLPVIDPNACDGRLRCLEACPSRAMRLYGEVRGVNEILDLVEEDMPFYARSGGGMTLSGGEPMAQPGFALALAEEAARRHVNRSMETCGHCRWEDLAAVCARLNGLIFDIKCLSPDKHKRFTGVDSRLILANFARLCHAFPDLPILVRTPVIPGFNDNNEDIRAILSFLPRRTNLRYELLAYHRLGRPKYGYLGRNYAMGDQTLQPGVMEGLQALVEIWNAQGRITS